MEIINRNIKKKDVSQRIGLTILLIILSRLGTFIPIPGVDHDAFYQSIATNPIVSFLNVFSGGGFASIGIFIVVNFWELVQPSFVPETPKSKEFYVPDWGF